MDPKQHLETHNCFVYANYYNAIAQDPKILTFAEVGVWKGHSITHLVQKMLDNGKKNIVAFAVDNWNPKHITYQKFPELSIIYDIYKTNVEKAGLRQYITDIKMDSWDAARYFEDCSLDFVFIDADHTYDCVKADILAYLPKVKVGGIIAGHDYLQIAREREMPDVKTAVDEFYNNGVLKSLTLHEGNVWQTIKESA